MKDKSVAESIPLLQQSDAEQKQNGWHPDSHKYDGIPTMDKTYGALAETKELELLAAAAGPGELLLEEELSPTAKRLALIGLCLTTTIASMVYSLLAPLFPDEAAAKGVSDSVVGMIFSCFALVALITSPFLGKVATVVGRRRLLFAGLVLLSVTTASFGFLSHIPDPHTFVVACFVVRLLQGLGAAAVEVASYSTLATIFHDNISFAIGLSEATYGIGYMVGPPVAGLIFEFCGYTGPFLVVSALALLLLFPLSILIPKHADYDDEEEGDELALRDIISRGAVLLVAGAATMSNSSCSFLEPTLGAHVYPFLRNKALLGVLFFIMSCAYAVVAPLTGWSSHRDRFGPKTVVIGGLALISVGFFLLGPSPLFDSLHPSLTLIVVSLIIIGIGQNMAMLPVLDYLLTASDDLTIDSINVLSGVVNSAFSLGEVIGPVVGGSLVSSVGFEWASTVWALTLGFYCLVLSGFFCWEWSKVGGYMYQMSVKYVTVVVHSAGTPGEVLATPRRRPATIEYDRAPVQISRRGRYHKVNKGRRSLTRQTGSHEPSGRLSLSPTRLRNIQSPADFSEARFLGQNDTSI